MEPIQIVQIATVIVLVAAGAIAIRLICATLAVLAGVLAAVVVTLIRRDW